MALRVWPGCGVMAFLYTIILTSCSTVTTSKEQSQSLTGEVQFDTQFDKLRFEEAVRIWEEESGENGDPFSAGKSAYDIAFFTHDPKWAEEAIRRLIDARKLLPDFAQVIAYQGSAHALLARDFPLQGLWMLVPGPGFVRIYHVKRAEALLNKAIEKNSLDPVVRLLRAGTISSMPQILISGGVAETDFSLLESWDANPQLNPEYDDVLESSIWKRRFYVAYINRLSEGQNEIKEEYYRAKLLGLEKEGVHNDG